MIVAAGADVTEHAIDSYWELLQSTPFLAFAELEDAALVDGCSPWQSFRHVAVPLAWPAGLHTAFIWSGCSASTPKFLSILRDWRTSSAEREVEYRARMDALTATAQAAVAALTGGDSAGFLRCASVYAQDLRALGSASGVSIWSAEHEAIARIANAHDGVVYKPCGAGGGDVGVVFAMNPDSLAAAVAALAASGFANVPLAVDPTGLRLTLTESEEA